MTREAYGYVGGNPLNGTDPTGMNMFSDFVSSAASTVVPDCALGKNPNGSCRGTIVGTDLKVAGVVLGGTALIIGTAGLAAPGLAVGGVGIADVAFGLTVASTTSSVLVAGIECPGHWDRNCAIDIAEAAGSVVATGFGRAALTAGAPGLRVVSNVVGLGYSTAALIDICDPSKSIFE